ncbi:MAG TPA: TadG family pilus assembly protein [Tepidisphaeraceae bacterium]|nr:TadG family pilus assembly protein [Tepidisphaeraceae bacterium]
MAFKHIILFEQKQIACVSRRRCRARMGMTLIYSIIAISALFALISLAVDLGRVQLVKTELQRAADAAARYGASGVSQSNSVAVARAVAAAADNQVDGSSVVIQNSDVQVGYWGGSPATFTSGGLPNNAVRVTARRVASRGNPVPLLFARVLGLSSCNVSAVSIASVSSSSTPYAFVGISQVTMSGNSDSDSYNSNNGPYSAGSAGSEGSIGSNGDVNLTGKSNIHGDVHPGPSGSLTQGNKVTISGSTSNLTSPMNFSNVDASPYASSNNNSNIPSQFITNGDLKVNSNKSLTIPAGTYYFNDVTFNGNSDVSITGAVTIYVTGNFTMSGHADTNLNLPSNFKIRVQGAGSVKIAGSTDLYADIYAPEADITVSGTGDLFGDAVGDTLKITGNGSLHYDKSLSNSSSGGTQLISMVK